jgi:HIRAN domain
MAEQRVSLSKKQLATAAGADLLRLCQSIKSDGRLSKDDIINLASWLTANKQDGLPGVDFLYGVVERIVADKKVTADEMKELHAAIEKVMPGDARKVAVESRKGIEKAKKQRQKEIEWAAREADKQAERLWKEQERERRRQEWANRPQGFHSKVYGVTQQNDDGSDRQTIIRDYVRPGMQLIVKREPDNPYDDFAISLWVKARTLGIFESQRQIGYINSSVAEDLAPYLDKGGWSRITVKDVTGGGDRNFGVNIFIEDGRERL